MNEKKNIQKVAQQRNFITLCSRSHVNFYTLNQFIKMDNILGHKVKWPRLIHMTQQILSTYKNGYVKYQWNILNEYVLNEHCQLL